MINLSDIPVISEEIAIRDLGDEIILISENGDELHTLVETGKFIWERIDGLNSILSILNILCEEYDVNRLTAEKDLKEFIKSLQKKGVVILKVKE